MLPSITLDRPDGYFKNREVPFAFIGISKSVLCDVCSVRLVECSMLECPLPNVGRIDYVFLLTGGDKIESDRQCWDVFKRCGQLVKRLYANPCLQSPNREHPCCLRTPQNWGKERKDHKFNTRLRPVPGQELARGLLPILPCQGCPQDAGRG